MQSASWRVDDNSEESFIDADRPEDDDEEYSFWSLLPDLILEKIFSYLTMRERYYASMVCHRWNSAFYLPFVWSRFVFEENTLTRRKFNYYMGWQHDLDHLRTQLCFARIGRHIQALVFLPMYNFHNLYEFMNMAAYFIENRGTSRAASGFGDNIRSLSFAFSCDMGEGTASRWGTGPGGHDVSEAMLAAAAAASPVVEEKDLTPKQKAARRRASRVAAFEARRGQRGPEVFGTGGRLLEALKRLLLDVAPGLRTLSFRDLLLEEREGQRLLDDVCAVATTTLRRLTIVNVTRHHSELLHAGVFVNLQVLVISPQNIGPDVVMLLGKTKLRHLQILQNRFYAPGSAHPVHHRVWRRCRQDNPALRVHLRLEEGVRKWRRQQGEPEAADEARRRELLWQEGAPVASVIYESPYAQVSIVPVLTMVELYGTSLEVFGHTGLPHFRGPRTFHDRADSLLLHVCKRCPALHTLVVRERVSTATLMLLAETAPCLRNLVVRRNAVVLRCDWPPAALPDTLVAVQRCARSYEATEEAVSRALGRPWRLLSDRQFHAVAKKLTSDELLI
ncbi:uncharacterized protein LOC124156840 [Ischnura elegans]|uniref:uncharacterized protein LOC124156840 n=1 Tax=Ischnura elegans TaxID=197161 RepID=UPI001ED8AFBD|nr:uncharacterized protein LOC124156840 [Ischnura elegans]